MYYLIRLTILTFLTIFPAVSAQEPNKADGTFKRGDEYLQSQKYNEAIKEFEKAITLRPDWAEAYFKLGLAHSRFPLTDKDKPDHNKASIEAFQKALRLKPDFAEAHTNLAIVYLYQGQYSEGIDRLNEAIRIDPKLALAHRLLGFAYLAVENRDAATRQYDILKSLDSEAANLLLEAIQRPEKFTFGVTRGKIISNPKPEYPAAARQQRIAGAVTVQLVINEEGKVTSAKAVSGPSELHEAAEAAALKARFEPTRLSGKPVTVNGVITYNFVPR
jgi:TonB family protein